MAQVTLFSNSFAMSSSSSSRKRKRKEEEEDHELPKSNKQDDHHWYVIYVLKVAGKGWGEVEGGEDTKG